MNLEHVKKATELGLEYLYDLREKEPGMNVLLDGFGDTEWYQNPDIIWFRFVQVNHWISLSVKQPEFKCELGKITTTEIPDPKFGDYGWVVYIGPDYKITAEKAINELNERE